MKLILVPFFLLLPVSIFAQKNAALTEGKNEPFPAGITAIITKNTVVVSGGKKIDYTAYSGFLSLQNDTGKLIAKVFFTYYKKDVDSFFEWSNNVK